MSVAVNAKFSTFASASPIRVMIVDDSVVVRSHIRHWITSESGLELVASVRSGREAVDKVSDVNPDVVVLDIEMPDLDGISALPLLLAKKPNLAVIIASTLTRRNAEITLKALALGALDCISKPDAMMPESLVVFRRELIAKVLELGTRRSAMRGSSEARRAAPDLQKTARSAGNIRRLAADHQEPSRTSEPFALRPFSRISPRVLLIGASTGGPQALTTLVTGLVGVSERAPILITQHMPPMFTTILAEHLTRTIGRPVHEANDGEAVLAGRIYLAPGGRHMRVARHEGTAVIVLDDGAPIHHCRPAVDPLFSSGAEIWRSWVLGVVLTGMGADGKQGATAIVDAGGSVLAQNEATSVVWGMPGAVAESGLCSAVLAIDDMALKVAQLFSGDRE